MSNDVIVEAWNTVLFEKFSRFKYLFIEGYASISEEIFQRNPFSKGGQVLDIGCGFGDSTIAIANMLGPEGKAVGIDCASNFIAKCNEEADRQQVHNVSFKVVDVENKSIDGPFDEVFARFGTMFFNLPGRAMGNIRKALKPGGKFTQVVWRRREDNPWLYAAEECVKKIVPVVSHDETDAVHCGPGPFSMAGPDMVSDMLQSVGFERVQFERFDSEICIGRSIEEAIQFALEIGPAGEILRLAEEEGERLRPMVECALADVISQFERANGKVWAPSSCWFVTAYKPL